MQPPHEKQFHFVTRHLTCVKVPERTSDMDCASCNKGYELVKKPCPDECISPGVLNGGAHNGGVNLENKICTKYSSRPYGGKRYCGDGNPKTNPKGSTASKVYKEGGGINCGVLCKGDTKVKTCKKIKCFGTGWLIRIGPVSDRCQTSVSTCHVLGCTVHILIAMSHDVRFAESCGEMHRVISDTQS